MFSLAVNTDCRSVLIVFLHILQTITEQKWPVRGEGIQRNSIQPTTKLKDRQLIRFERLNMNSLNLGGQDNVTHFVALGGNAVIQFALPNVGGVPTVV